MSGESGLSLCECVGVCDKKSAVCYRLSVAPAFHSLVTRLLEHTLSLFCQFFPPTREHKHVVSLCSATILSRSLDSLSEILHAFNDRCCSSVMLLCLCFL